MPRKRRAKRSPAKISKDTWAICQRLREQGMGYADISRITGVNSSSIMTKEDREGWLTEKQIRKRAKQIAENGDQILPNQSKMIKDKVVLNKSDESDCQNYVQPSPESSKSLIESRLEDSQPKSIQEMIKKDGITLDTLAQMMLADELRTQVNVAEMANQKLIKGMQHLPVPENWSEAAIAQRIAKSAVDTVRPKESNQSVNVNLFTNTGAGKVPPPPIDI